MRQKLSSEIDAIFRPMINAEQPVEHKIHQLMTDACRSEQLLAKF